MTERLIAGPDQLTYLIDRAAITELIHDFARCIDDKDGDAYADNFVEDAELILPFAHIQGREVIRSMPGPPPTWATHHHLGTVSIKIDGDTATSRAHLIATHVFDAERRTQKAHAGGWYVHDLVRTADGWRFARVELVVIWESETPMLPEDASVA